MVSMKPLVVPREKVRKCWVVLIEPHFFFLWPGLIDYFINLRDKINWNYLVPRLGPRASTPALDGGQRFQPVPAWAPGGSIFFFCISWIPPKFQFFLPSFSWISTKIIKKNQWNPGHKNKKIWVVYHEIQHWWYLGQILISFTNQYNIQMRIS